MKKLQPYLILGFLLLSGCLLFAQPNKKVSPALHKFLNTEFMLKFHDLRIEAESAVINVQTAQQLQADERYRLRSAYDQTAQRANKIITTIKQDFMNRKKLKTISQFPEMYSDGLRYKLQELADFYATSFQQPLADATMAQQEDGAALFLLITELVGLTKGLVGYFGQMERESKLYTESYLNTHLVSPYRWRYWDELSGGVSPYEKFEMTQNPAGNQPWQDPVQQPAGSDPLQEQIDKWSQRAQQQELQQQQPEVNMEIPVYTEDFSGTAVDTLPPDTPFSYEDWNTDVPVEDVPAATGRNSTDGKAGPQLSKQSEKQAGKKKKGN